MDDCFELNRIKKLSDLIRSKQLSPVEVVKHYISRATDLDGYVRAYTLPLFEEALVAAKNAEREICSGDWRGILHGIPIGLKDVYDVGAQPTAGCCAAFAQRIAENDSDVAGRLRTAGAIIVGKLTTTELAVGDNGDPRWPAARNPWNLNHSAGASSSGPAAGVAAGFFPGAMGTDTGSSIRQPAALCGIAGLKPTYELISRGGTLPMSFTMDHCGPLGQTSEDCGILMRAMAEVGRLKSGFRINPKSGKLPLNGLRIGLVRNFYEDDLPPSEEVLASFEMAVSVFQSLGAEISDAPLPSLETFLHVANLIWRPEAYAYYGEHLADRESQFGLLCKRRIESGASIAAFDYVNALRERAKLIFEVNARMQDVDILLTPSVAATACKIASDSAVSFPVNYHRPFNITGQPALSVCSGLSSVGLPIGIQIIGRAFEDELVIEVGGAFEAATKERTRKPDLDPAKRLQVTPMFGQASDDVERGGTSEPGQIQHSIEFVRARKRDVLLGPAQRVGS